MSATAEGPGWWLASDGRWYPPSTAPSRVVTAPPPAPEVPTAPAASAPGPETGRAPAPRGRTPWELAEGVAAALLVAAVLRFAGVIVATGIWGSPPAPTHGQRLGLLLQSAFEYADGEGVLLLLVILGLLWWQAVKWSERRWIVQHYVDAQAAAAEVAGHLSRTRRLLRCTGVLFALGAIGGAAFIAGLVFEYIGDGSWRTQWYHIAGSGSLEAAYVLASMAGLVAVRHLLAGLSVPTSYPAPA